MDFRAIIEANIADSVKEAVVNAKRIIQSRSVSAQVLPNEEVGIFITCLRTSIIQRENEALISLMQNDNFRLIYEQTKIQLFNKNNWKDVGEFGEPSFSWHSNQSGRMKKIKCFSRPGIRDIDDDDFTFGRNYRSNTTDSNMDKSRIQQVVSQANREVSGYDFESSFGAMEESLREMKRLAVQHETLSGKATQVTESLCAVAESLVLDTESAGV